MSKRERAENSMDYGSPFYILMIAILLAVCFLTAFLLKKTKIRVQKTVLLILMIINVIQHLFKWAIYPIYWGQGFSALSTAYNMCALLILVMPIAYLSRCDSFKDYVFLAGAFAGFITNVIPYWHISIPVSELGWEYARFYICHGLLFLSGILPLLLGHHKLSYKRFFAVGVCFILSLFVILINDVIFIVMGKYPGLSSDDLFASLSIANPCMAMHPSADFPIIERIASALTPDALFKNSDTGAYIPILWFVIPSYLFITVASFILMAIIDRRELSVDLRYVLLKFRKSK